MFDGIIAFSALTVIIWFLIGMVAPGIALPPILIKILETSTTKPSRKLVVQWSSIFMMIVLGAVIAIEVFLPTDPDAPVAADGTTLSMQVTTTKLTLIELINENSNAVDKSDPDDEKCKLLFLNQLTTINTLVKKIAAVNMFVETNPDGAIAALVEINVNIKALQHNLRTSECAK